MKLHTVKEVAALLGVHPESVRRMIRSGRLKASRPGNFRISEKEIQRLLGGNDVSKSDK